MRAAIEQALDALEVGDVYSAEQTLLSAIEGGRTDQPGRLECGYRYPPSEAFPAGFVCDFTFGGQLARLEHRRLVHGLTDDQDLAA